MKNPLIRSLAFVSFLTLPLVSGPVVAQVAERPPGLGPFEPLREPRFVPAAKANFLTSGDQVLGVSVNGVAKAYPAQVVAWHHIIQDQLGSMPILATW